LPAHAAAVARGPRGAQGRAAALWKARFEFRWEDHSTPSLDPEKAREFHDATLPADGAKVAHFCSMCGPHFCSMQLTQEVRAADVEQGLKEKAEEFRRGGGGSYRWGAQGNRRGGGDPPPGAGGGEVSTGRQRSAANVPPRIVPS